MANIVVRDALDIAQAHGQHGLGAVEGLDRALLIHAKHQGMVGRIQVQADDVPYLLEKNGSVESLKLRLRWSCTAKV